MSSMIERARSSHEQLEMLERLITSELHHDSSTYYDQLISAHRTRHLIDKTVDITHNLIHVYESKDLQHEISPLGDQDYIFGLFYQQLKELKETHKNNNLQLCDHQILEELEQPYIRFTGEEALGRYIDLHELYNMYINLNADVKKSHDQTLDYTTYLEIFSTVDEIMPSKVKTSSKYRKYVANLLEYMVSFVERTEPLMDLDRVFSEVEVEFDEELNRKKKINLDYIQAYSSIKELIELGPEKLKQALVSLGLKSGGTMQQRAERLLLARNTALEKLDSKHFARESQGQLIKEIELMEAKVKKLCEILKEVISRTKEHVKNRQAMSQSERKADIEGDNEVFPNDMECDEEDVEVQQYNPLKLPIGFDGKPIPYWLYKLHGLGQEFKCEICGDYRYQGRRTFERHFKESRHQQGMRCLGIPNTKSFFEITSIDDAKKLWEEIRQRQGLTQWRPELAEECEDDEGNVYNKKTFVDLKRQGLV